MRTRAHGAVRQRGDFLAGDGVDGEPHVLRVFGEFGLSKNGRSVSENGRFS
jgi:hypothetical protein